MSGLEKDQLQALRRQVEDDYRLDIAAIERLQQRFLIALSNIPAGNYSAPANGSNGDSRATIQPPQAFPEPTHEDELVGSLRSMFETRRK